MQLSDTSDGKRKSIRLGKVSQRVAEEIRVKVEQLAATSMAGLPPDRDTSAWLTKIGDDLADKLAAAGLIPHRRTTTVGQWLKTYRDHRADVADGTSTNYGIISRRLLAFFPADRLMHTITEAEADRWLVKLKQDHAGATVAKSIKVARQFWAQAIRACGRRRR